MWVARPHQQTKFIGSMLLIIGVGWIVLGSVAFVGAVLL
jgi:hypothetical protein